MVIQLYSCGACTAHLKFGAIHCDVCREETPLFNRRYTWVMALFSVSVMALLAAIILRAPV
jgi:hypothetical protein